MLGHAQGMNCGFEDALVLKEILVETNNDLSKAVPLFAARRRPDADAIGVLSLENYAEMRSHTAKRSYVVKKKVESLLHWLAPSHWTPRYSMVAFSRTPYSEALAKSQRQEWWLSVMGV